jgi:dipeptidase
VADLCADGSRLPIYWCSFYSPCLGVFFPVFSEGTLPACLAVGDAAPSDDSPWWLFHRLSRFVRSRPEERVPEIRERWGRLEAEFFETAQDMAERGRRLMDQRRPGEAAQLLTEYMERNVETVLQTARGITAD